MVEKQTDAGVATVQKTAPIAGTHKVHQINLAAFDFEGTLIYSPDSKSAWEFVKKSTWELIGGALGAEAERIKMRDAFLRGEFDYITWISKSIDNFKRHGLTKQMLEDIITNHTEIMPGTKELFNELRSKGIKIAIISGGIKNVYDIFAEKYGITVDYLNMATELTFDRKGRLTGGIMTNIDDKGKVTVLQNICHEMGISKSQVCYVGDASNDIKIMGVVGLPVAINTMNDAVRSAASFVIEDKDISGILRHLPQ